MGRTNDLPTSYHAALTRLGKRDERKVANNTWLVRRADGVAVRLWRTDVVTFREDGRIELYTGGWNTPTTRSRFNACLSGFSVWSGGRRAPNVLHRHGGEDYYFESDVEIQADGTVNAPQHLQRLLVRRRRRVPPGQREMFPRPVVTECPDIPGADDQLVRAEGVGEERWAEVNRKFNALFARRSV